MSSTPPPHRNVRTVGWFPVQQSAPTNPLSSLRVERARSGACPRPGHDPAYRNASHCSSTAATYGHSANIETNCTAAHWRNDFGLELRVEHGGELIESRLSRYGIEPLLPIADQIRSNLIAQGWFEPTNATH